MKSISLSENEQHLTNEVESGIKGNIKLETDWDCHAAAN